MSEEKKPRMKPMMILPPDAVSRDNIKQLRDNGICVVIAKDPTVIKFIEPPPFNYTSDYSQQEMAAIELSRRLLTSGGADDYWQKKNFTDLFVKILIEGSPLGKSEPAKKS